MPGVYQGDVEVSNRSAQNCAKVASAGGGVNDKDFVLSVCITKSCSRCKYINKVYGTQTDIFSVSLFVCQ